MYNYNFKENKESLIKEEKNVNIKVKKNYYMTNFVLTEKHLLIFYDLNRNNALSSRLVQMMPQYELLLKLELDNIKYEKNDDDFILIVNGEKIYCYNFDVCKFANKNL